ncbi:MAG: hypothetical protein ACOY0T_26175 [Myxococcota bacterium]
MRPRANATLLARVTATVPARLVKKLDNSPRAADTWSWSDTVVTTDSGETVTLTPEGGVVNDIGQIRCSCLLSPRCFHVLAVVAALEPDDAQTHTGASDGTTTIAPESAVAVTPEQRAIAEQARGLVGDWLIAGAAAAGAVLQGELLRVVHEARLAGAYRLAGAALRVVRGARALREARPDFDAHDLLNDLRELGSSAHLLATRGELSSAAVGTARREYTSIGSLRLRGIGTEPVVARGGYAGVTSYVCDERGTIYSVSDVLPADVSRAFGAYELAIIMGDTSLSHRELTRGGLFVQNATASGDLRLGAGKQVKAVRGNSGARFDEPELARLFDVPLAEQLDRAFAALSAEGELTPKSASLVFVRARVLGHGEDALVVAVDDTALAVVAADEHPELPYRENLRLLSELVGRTLLLVAHVVPERPRTLAAITLQADSDALALPETMAQRVNLGLERLKRSELVQPTRARVDFHTGAALDPLAVLRRRLISLALNGANSLPPEAAPRIERDRAALHDAVMSGAADALGALARASFAARHARTQGGLALAEAYVSAASYERAATLAIRRATFLDQR